MIVSTAYNDNFVLSYIDTYLFFHVIALAVASKSMLK